MPDRSELANYAEDFMKQGGNCCEAVVRAANKVWELDLPSEVIVSTALFKSGMGGGCTCGALVGMVMISGILQERWGHPLNNKLAASLTSRFQKEFGSTSCREICKSRPLVEKIGRKGCINLTARTAGILGEVWGDVRKQAD